DDEVPTLHGGPRRPRRTQGADSDREEALAAPRAAERDFEIRRRIRGRGRLRASLVSFGPLETRLHLGALHLRPKGSVLRRQSPVVRRNLRLLRRHETAGDGGSPELDVKPVDGTALILRRELEDERVPGSAGPRRARLREERERRCSLTAPRPRGDDG